MILVAGGTGRLGSLVVSQLSRHGKATRLLGRGQCDLRDRKQVELAVEGADAVVAAAHGLLSDPKAVDAQGNINLIEASHRAGVKHFVLISIYGAAPDHPMDLFRAKHQAEMALRESGLPHTIIRPTAFAELWLQLLRTAPIVGGGRNPNNFVSAHDVADRVAAALLEGGAGEFDLGGPDNLGLQQLADLAGLAPKHVPRAAARVVGQLLRPVKPAMARLMRLAVHMDTADMTFANGAGLSVRDVIRRDAERMA